MISKVITGKSFLGCCRYVCMDEKRAIVLDAEGVRGHDYRLMAADFEVQRGLRPNKKNAVFHGILSFPQQEDPGNEKLVAIAREYLQKIGMGNTQHSITKHIDKKHMHLHVIANLVDNDGKPIPDSWLGLRAKKVSQELTIKYQLQQAVRKNLAQTHLESLNNYEAARYSIYQVVTEALSTASNMKSLQVKLAASNIDTQLKYSSEQNQLQGVSFKHGVFSFKGSAIDRELSAKKIEQKLALNLSQRLIQETSEQQQTRERRGMRI